jgi:hypothetical protein
MSNPNTNKWPKDGGNSHNPAELVDLQELSVFFNKQGYSILNLDQRWRHVHGVLNRDNRNLFLKLASTAEIGVRTKNEVSWNDAVADKLLESSGGKIIVPKIRQTGSFNGRFFYLADYYEGDLAADHDPPRTESLSERLSSLVLLAIHLNKLSDDSLWYATEPLAKEELVRLFFDDVDRWQRSSGRDDLGVLREFVEPLRQHYLPRLSHGDFVPWHVILNEEKMVLIDGEWGWSGRPRYYDVAYFCHRVATSAARPDLAKSFLGEFMSELPESEKLDFKAQFIPLIAARSIGGFYDVTVFEDQKRVEAQHLRFKDMIVSGELL